MLLIFRNFWKFPSNEVVGVEWSYNDTDNRKTMNSLAVKYIDGESDSIQNG